MQYSADEGRATDWHTIHLGNLALSGAALLVIEATAVLPAAHYPDVSAWSDETEESLGRMVGIVRRYSDMPIAIQLAHAGRKVSTCHGREGRRSAGRGARLANGCPVANSILTRWNPPMGLDRDGQLSSRARSPRPLGGPRGSIDGLDPWCAWISAAPVSITPANRRQDDMAAFRKPHAFPLDVFDAVRKGFPTERPVSMRTSGTDWVAGGWISTRQLHLRRRLRRAAAVPSMCRAAA
jgi:2,4-dienoyl-CoA reductase-like NADH-dependent reductase (Old Yellow Enzyme family)